MELLNFLNSIELTADEFVINTVQSTVKFVAPIIVVLIILSCAKQLLTWKGTKEVWAKFKLPDGSFVPLTHWENLLGRAKSCDVIVNYPSVSRNHAVITRKNKDEWMVTDLKSKSGTEINGKKIKGNSFIKHGDKLSVGGIDLIFCKEEAVINSKKSTNKIKSGHIFFLLTILQILCALSLYFNIDSPDKRNVIIIFSALILFMWIYYAVASISGRKGYEIECLAFLLTTIGFCATASVDVTALPKQFFAMVAGIIVFVFLCIILRYYEFSKKWRWIVAPMGIILLIVTYLFADTINGARNWIYIGSVSIQPSEFAKIAFIYAGTATLDRLMAKRNILLFAIFSVCCMGMLALMNDFGTASVFFITFVVIAFLRSGDFSTFVLSGAGIGLAGGMVLKFKPYVVDRFKAWRHVWDYAYDLGYQQTRTLMYLASGGLLGVGAGQGYLRYVAAADTDLVFGLISEEWGLIIALSMVCAVIILAGFVFKSASFGRSSFYIIAACAATSIFCFQTILNVFGSVDILPLTGVTFPFVSNGGSSMIVSWGLLAFIKAADVRVNGSFAAVSFKPQKRGVAK